MEKQKRTKKDYQGGCGKTIFESDLFRVTHWSHGPRGHRTVIQFASDREAIFDGHQNFLDEKICLKQLTVLEVKAIIRYEKKISFAEGKNEKIKEFQDILKKEYVF